MVDGLYRCERCGDGFPDIASKIDHYRDCKGVKKRDKDVLLHQERDTVGDEVSPGEGRNQGDVEEDSG